MCVCGELLSVDFLCWHLFLRVRLSQQLNFLFSEWRMAARIRAQTQVSWHTGRTGLQKVLRIICRTITKSVNDASFFGIFPCFFFHYFPCTFFEKYFLCGLLAFFLEHHCCLKSILFWFIERQKKRRVSSMQQKHAKRKIRNLTYFEESGTHSLNAIIRTARTFGVTLAQCA